MKSKVSLIALALIVLFHPDAVLSQMPVFKRIINPFPVENEQQQAWESPFLGGFNQPRPQFVDLDADGKLDLLLQEEFDRLIYFRNTGTPSNARFEWQTDDFQNLSVGNWFLIADFNNDGHQDVLSDAGRGHIRFWRGEQGLALPDFSLLADSLIDTANNAIFVEFPNIPSLADIDCDGTLDLFLGQQTGQVAYYHGEGLDENGVPRFRLVTDAFQDILIVGFGKAARQKNRNRHGANSLVFTDIDNDRDQDLFWGDFFASSIYFLENTGGCAEPNLAITTDKYPQPDTLATGGFNVPRFADIDSDGDQDLFVGVQGGVFETTRDFIHTFFFYKNMGSPAQPQFLKQTESFIETLDFGLNSAPAFTDIDADGDIDLFVVNESDTASVNNGRLYFFENTGRADSPRFQLASKNYLESETGFNPLPAFVDLDGDGDADLVMGNWDGTLLLFRNQGTGSSPAFAADETLFADIDVGNNSAPAWADIDADGDVDLFVGEFNGGINFYRNIGGTTAAQFTADATVTNGVQTGSYSHPALADIDRDGDFDLFIGTFDAGVSFYENIGTPQHPEFSKRPMDLKTNRRFAPVFVDIDADGDLDLFGGAETGGLFYFENMEVTSIVHEPDAGGPSTFSLLRNYPNPFNPTTTIAWALPETAGTGTAEIVISNAPGHFVQRLPINRNGGKKSGTVTWNGENKAGKKVSSGVYFYQLLHEGRVQKTAKMLLLR